MALPHRRQQLAKFIAFHDLTYPQVAAALGTNTIRVANLTKGHTYPSPEEIEALQRLFGLPPEVLFDAEMLEFRDGPWPVPEGTALFQFRAEMRARRESGE